MRRIAPLVLLTALSGCGYQTWSSPPFVVTGNPNAPASNSETLRRVMGEPVHVKPLTPQAGDVWPGPLPPTPTLQDLEQQTSLPPLPEQPVPGSPQAMGTAPTGQPPAPPPQRPRGSSTPPRARPGLPPPVVTQTPPGSAAPPPAREPGGQVVQTPSGPGVTSGGSSGYQTMTLPNGGSAIVIPNGNGTSTVIRSDGSIETIPTPKSK